MSRKSAKNGNPSLMISRGGSYLWLGDEPNSRYQGWFFQSAIGLIKIIDDIEAKNGGRFLALENGFWRGKRIRQNTEEKFFVLGGDCLGYEIASPADIRLFLDVKEPYKNPEFGRGYSISRKDNLLLINYRQEKDFLLPEIFLAVCGDIADMKMENKWIRREYPLDKKRGSRPFVKWVFLPAEIFASKLVFAAGTDKEKTIARAKSVWRDYEKIKEQKQSLTSTPFFLSMFAGESAKQNRMAKICAKNAIKSLIFKQNNKPALRAGLPWFFQIWQRDEAVCLPGAAVFNENLTKEIFWRQINGLKNNGYRFDTADGVGWLFFAASQFLKQNRFDEEEKKKIFDCLRKSIDHLLKNNTQDDLAVNDDCQKTWMDSLDRSGAAIEIQALRLNMYSLAARLASGKKEKEDYAKLEKNLRQQICQKFLDKFQLADKFDIDNNRADFTVRPNIFLAAHICPDLFPKEKWRKIFDLALPKLWLDWGGLTTIDKSDARFCPKDTGENPKSYHNGDSWFWVNNIAAMVLAKTDYRKYKDCIEKIFQAGKNDILWHGAIGCASEISSAQNYEPCGCPNQAWSVATFLQLCAQLKK